MRFWLTAAFFAVLNLTAWVVHHGLETRALDLVQVESFSPGADQVLAAWRVSTSPFGVPGGGNPFAAAATPAAAAPVRTASAPLRLRFNVGMDTGGDLVRTPPGRFSPPLAGEWRWADERELVFTSSQPPLATAFTLTLDQQALRTRDGFRMGRPFSATFRTSPLEVHAAGVLHGEVDGTYHLFVECSDTVSAGDARAAIHVVGQDGAPVAIRSYQVVDGTRVVLVTEPLAQARRSGGPFVATLRVKAGLTGTSGPLGLASDRSFPLVFDRALRLERAYANMHDGEGLVHLAFNRAVATDALRRVLTIDPAVAVSIEGGGGSSAVVRGAFQPGQRYAVVIAEPPAGAPGVFPLSDRMPVWMPDHAPEVWFPDGSGRLGAQGTRTLAVKAVNLRGATLRIWRLIDNNLLGWVARPEMRSAWQVSALGQPLVDRRLTFGETKNHIHDLRLDLERELPAEARREGVLLVQIEDRYDDSLIDPAYGSWRWRSYRRQNQVVVSLSDLALTCQRGAHGCTVWATSLSGATPVAGVRLRLVSAKQQDLGSGVTGDDGLATIAEATPGADDRATALIAESPGGGVAWLALTPVDALRDPSADTGGAPRSPGLSAFIHAERGVWRPGETAHLRALVRDHSDQVPATVPLRWRIRRPDWKVWREEVATTLASGDLLLDLPLPDDAPTGRWQVELTLPGDDQVLGSLDLTVEDYLPDRLTIAFSHRGAGLLAEQPGQPRSLLVENGEVTLQAQADYLFGKPASGRTLKAWARLDPTVWTPPGEAWREWTFGDAADSREPIDRVALGGTRIDLPPATADAQGAGSWEVAVRARCAELGRGRAMPWRLLTGGEVQEVGGRAVSGLAPTVIVHPVRTWLGARLVSQGATTALELRSAAVDGAVVPLTATVHLRREQWSTTLERVNDSVRYRSVRELVPLDGAPATIAVGDTGARWIVPADLGPGTYAVCIEVQETRQLLSLYHRPGAPDGWLENISRARPDRCEIAVRPAPPVEPLTEPAAVPASATHLTVGGEALVTIRSPFPGRALLSVCTDRVIATQVLELTGTAQEVRLPVTAAWRPDAFVCVSVVRRVEPSAAVRLHRAWGVVRVRTDESARRLAVEVAAPPMHRPGTTLPVAVQVRDAGGLPLAGAGVTLAVVDEGILRLTDHHTPDPYAWLIRPRALGVGAWDAFGDLLPELPRAGGESLIGGDGAKAMATVTITNRHRPALTARRVVPLAFWSGLLTSDADGRVAAAVPVPPAFNGRVRVMAVVAHGHAAGSAEGWSTVRGPVVLHSSWPRFAAPGDRFRVSASVMNLAGATGRITTRLTLPADGLLTAGIVEQTHAVVADGEAAPVFELTAAQLSGVARAVVSAELQVPGADGTLTTHTIAEPVELVVRPPSPRISLGGEAAVGVAAAWDGVLPQGFLPGSTTVELRVGPRPTFAVPRGLDYLYRYPYGCVEQTTSACFPLVHLRDLGEQLAPGMFSAAGITRRLNDGIMRLQLMENDRGLVMWPGASAPWSWATVYATHFLVEAKRAGHAVPEDFLRRMLTVCRRVDAYNGWEWTETQAYACYVLASAGQPAHALMQRLEEVLKHPASEREIGPSARSWLAAAWLAAGRKDLAGALIPQRLPAWRSGRRLDGDLASPVRDRAVLLATLIEVAPDHPQIPGLAQELAALAPWSSTQDTAFALIALGRYLRVQGQSAAPESVSLVIDGKAVDTVAGAALRWSGTTAAAAQVRITGTPDARAWVSWLVSGVPLAPPAAAMNGLSVSRRWSDEQGRDLTGRPLTSGDLVRVDLVVGSDVERRGVVVEDLLPAGLEIENPRLRTSAAGQAPVADLQAERSEVRDDRLVAMGDLKPNGKGGWELHLSYLARAVTAGAYVVPPLRAECMYDIAINGIGGTGTVVVQAAE